MRLHVEALFTHDDDGCLVGSNEPSGAPAPRFFLGRSADGITLRFRHDVHPHLRRELEAAVADHALDALALDSPTDPSRYRDILARHAPVEKMESGRKMRLPVAVPRDPVTFMRTMRLEFSSLSPRK